jgi:hypothetical protein
VICLPLSRFTRLRRQALRSGGKWRGTYAQRLGGGKIPASFGLVVGTRDTLVGILAVVTGLYLYSGARGGRVMAIAWNTFGLLDFAIGNTVQTFVPISLR